MTLSCGVIVCAYTTERWDDIKAAMAGLASQTVAPAQIVLVIDHSDELLERARSEFPSAQVVANHYVQGLSGARNTGITYVDSDIVAFLDDDATPAPDWVERMTAVYEEPTVLAAGGLIIARWPGGGRPTWFPAEYDWTVGCSYTGLPTTRAPVRNPIGANMSFRREVFDLVDAFDSSVGRIGKRPLGCEETELCIRLRQAKPEALVIYDPSIVVYHRVTDGRATWKYFRDRCYAEGLSKATVSSLVGASDGLQSERNYTTKVLPAAAMRELRGVAEGDRTATRRLGAVVLGVSAAGAGYVRGTAAIRRRDRRARRAQRVADHLDALPIPGSFGPTQLIDLDLAVDGDPIAAFDAVARPAEYPHAQILLRAGAVPLGQLAIDHADPRPAHDELRRLAAIAARTEASAAAVATPSVDPSITVVIPTYNRPGSLTESLRSLARIEQPIGIVVVDNAPHLPQTRAVFEDLKEQLPGLRYVPVPEAGASRARNAGLAAVTTKYVAFTDDDVVVDRHWISGLLDAFAAVPDAACVTGLVLPAELETPAQAWFEEFGGFGKGLQMQIFDQTTNYGPLYPFTGGIYGSGNNVAFDAAALRSLGGYDVRLGPGTVTRAGEDFELFIRTIRRGGKIVYSPSAMVRHRHRRTTSELGSQLHDYGVGLSSAIVLSALCDPRAALEIGRRLPEGVRFLVSPRSSKNKNRTVTFPMELARAERIGVLLGPLALARSIISSSAA